MRKISALVLLSVMLFCALVPSALAQETPVAMMGFELDENYRSWPDNLFFARMQDKTGVSFSYRQYGKKEDYLAALNALKNEKDSLPEVLFKAALTPQLAQELYDAGVLVDLEPYLQEHAPNFYRIMEADPAIRQAITLEGGIIPTLPYVLDTMGQNILWLNTTWLEELKLAIPTTGEELESVLTAFATKDPNRNGQKDEIPLAFLGAYDLKYLAHAYGLIANDFNIFVEDGQVRYLPLEDNFPAFIRKMADWYKAGLLDKSGFTTMDSLRRVTDAKSVNRYGAFLSPLPTGLVPVEWTGEYTAVMPLLYEGQAVYRAVTGRVNFGTYALTSACRDIPGMLKWVDYLYTEEGAKLAGIGLENEDYVVDGDGSWRLLNENADRTYIAHVAIASDHAAPGISNEQFQMRYSDKTVRDLTEQTAAVAALSVLPFPEIPLTDEEVEKIAPLQAKLGRYVDESIARFVLGEWESDEARFNDFRKELDELGLEEFLAIWQSIYDKGMKQ